MISYDECYNTNSSNIDFNSLLFKIDNNTQLLMIKEDIANKLLYCDALLSNHLIDIKEHNKISIGLKEIGKRFENGTIPINNNKSIQALVKNTLNYYIGDISNKVYEDYTEPSQKINDLKSYIYTITKTILNNIIDLNMIMTSKFISKSTCFNFTSDILRNDIRILQHYKKSIKYENSNKNVIALDFFKYSSYSFNSYYISEFLIILSSILSDLNKLFTTISDYYKKELNKVISISNMNIYSSSIKVNSNINTILNITSFYNTYDYIDDIIDITTSSFNEYVSSLKNIALLIERGNTQ